MQRIHYFEGIQRGYQPKWVSATRKASGTIFTIMIFINKIDGSTVSAPYPHLRGPNTLTWGGTSRGVFASRFHHTPGIWGNEGNPSRPLMEAHRVRQFHNPFSGKILRHM